MVKKWRAWPCYGVPGGDSDIATADSLPQLLDELKVQVTSELVGEMEADETVSISIACTEE